MSVRFVCALWFFDKERSLQFFLMWNPKHLPLCANCGSVSLFAPILSLTYSIFICSFLGIIKRHWARLEWLNVKRTNREKQLRTPIKRLICSNIHHLFRSLDLYSFKVCLLLCEKCLCAVWYRWNFRNYHNVKSSLPGFAAVFDIFHLTTLTMDVEKSRDSRTYIFIHELPGWLAGWLAARWHLPDLKIKGTCDRNKIDIATPIHNIP